MNKPAAKIVLLLSLLFILNTACDEKGYNASLSDLGGVYSVKESDVDFSIEIARRLSEGNNEAFHEECASEVALISENGEISNKILRWGISRSSNHQTPNADPGAPELLKKYKAAYIGDTSKPVIYFTFDEGYENGYTPKILDVLKANNVKAIFFITGPYLSVHQDLVRRMVEEGHYVGNHTIHHPSLPSISDSELEEEVLGLDRAFHEKFGKHMKFLRPPKGEYSEKVLAITHKLGYCNLFWSFAYDDWYRDRIRGAEYAYNKVMNNLHNGAVLLLHAVSKDNADALDMIIKGARQKGYEIGDPIELLPE